MVQSIEPTTEVTAIIQVYEDIPIMKDSTCIAYLEGEQYKGIVVQAKSVPEALKELAISIEAINQYRINTNQSK